MEQSAIKIDSEQEELGKSIAYCDKKIAEGDELERGFFTMVRKTLVSKESKFIEWDNGRILREEQSHIDRILKNLKRVKAQRQKAIENKTCKTNNEALIQSLGVRVHEIRREYEHFKGEYGL
jgi:hypothetical protein